MTLIRDSINVMPHQELSGWKRFQAALRCDGCETLSIGFTVKQSDGQLTAGLLHWLGSEAQYTWEPKRSSGKEFPDVPQHIADAASEAHVCQSVGAHRAAGATGRIRDDSVVGGRENGSPSSPRGDRMEVLERLSIAELRRGKPLHCRGHQGSTLWGA